VKEHAHVIEFETWRAIPSSRPSQQDDIQIGKLALPYYQHHQLNILPTSPAEEIYHHSCAATLTTSINPMQYAHVCSAFMYSKHQHNRCARQHCDHTGHNTQRWNGQEKEQIAGAMTPAWSAVLQACCWGQQLVGYACKQQTCIFHTCTARRKACHRPSTSPLHVKSG
jgi:hypothetical protein